MENESNWHSLAQLRQKLQIESKTAWKKRIGRENNGLKCENSALMRYFWAKMSIWDLIFRIWYLFSEWKWFIQVVYDTLNPLKVVRSRNCGRKLEKERAIWGHDVSDWYFRTIFGPKSTYFEVLERWKVLLVVSVLRRYVRRSEMSRKLLRKN